MAAKKKKADKQRSEERAVERESKAPSERTHEQLAEDLMMAAVELNSLIAEARSRHDTFVRFRLVPKFDQTPGQVEVRVYKPTRSTPIALKWKMKTAKSVSDRKFEEAA